MNNFRALTRHYIARPDPLAWLAAADLLEEAGDTVGARKWRRRGEWYTAIRRAIGDAAAVAAQPGLKSPHAHRQIVSIGPFLAQVMLCMSERSSWYPVPIVQVRRCAAGVNFYQMEVVVFGMELALCLPEYEKYYHNKRTIELIDRLVAVEDAHG